jgi:hypothetical protein
MSRAAVTPQLAGEFSTTVEFVGISVLLAGSRVVPLESWNVSVICVVHVPSRASTGLIQIDMQLLLLLF